MGSFLRKKVDPAREGQQTTSYLIYNGKTIRFTASASTLEELNTALNDGGSVVLESTLSANTGSIVLNGGKLEGNGEALNITVKGSTDAAITTTGGTIANLQVNNVGISGTLGLAIGTRPYGSEKLTSDLTIDKVTVGYNESIFDRPLMYAIYAEAANDPDIVIKDSALYGAIDCLGASNFTATNTTFGSAEYWFFAISCDTSFTDCSFESTYCMLAYDVAADSTVTFTNCTVAGQKLTADNFKSLLVSTAWDYTSELSSTNLKDCIVVIDGVEVLW
jgi:hypothetical protein